MRITIEQAKTMVAEFCKQYPAAYQVDYRIRETQEELYGPQADPRTAGTVHGGYFAGYIDRQGQFHRGRCDIALAGIHSPEEFRRTLRHELVGHFGLNTLTPEEKRSVLIAMVDARDQVGIATLWERVDKNYAALSAKYPKDEAELRKAEEVYALACERIRPGHRADLSAGHKSLHETCIARIRPMQATDLARIAEMVAEGLRDRTQSQQTFPSGPNAQFLMAEGISNEQMQKIVHDRYERFDARRRQAEALAADAEDIRELEDVEKKSYKGGSHAS